MTHGSLTEGRILSGDSLDDTWGRVAGTRLSCSDQKRPAGSTYGKVPCHVKFLAILCVDGQTSRTRANFAPTHDHARLLLLVGDLDAICSSVAVWMPPQVLVLVLLSMLVVFC